MKTEIFNYNGNPVTFKMGGNGGGTWMCEDVAREFIHKLIKKIRECGDLVE